MIKSYFKKTIQSILYNIDFFKRKQLKFARLEELKKSGLLSIGKKSYGIDPMLIDVYKGSESKIKIGAYTSISKQVRFISGGIHPTDWVSLFPFRINYKLDNAYKDGMPISKGDITIGSDVWIGTDVLITSGVEIGDGAIVYPGAIVSKSLPPYSIAGGVPAKVIGYRYEQEVIDKMLQIKWWEWEEQKILENVDLLSSKHITSFLEKHFNT